MKSAARSADAVEVDIPDVEGEPFRVDRRKAGIRKFIWSMSISGVM
jgi:hypothetical protein